MGLRGELFSSKAVSEKRTFFFNVKENRRGDMFLNIVESKRIEGAAEVDRHQIVVYQEELDDFYSALSEAVEHVKERRWKAFKERRGRKSDRVPRSESAGQDGPSGAPDSASASDSVPPGPQRDSVPPTPTGSRDSVPPRAGAQRDSAPPHNSVPRDEAPPRPAARRDSAPLDSRDTAPDSSPTVSEPPRKKVVRKVRLRRETSADESPKDPAGE
ncbi:DUF3276 family protein [Spirochaeta africana]|uniref:DUF3276 family protein n=1 Tax=Spirochaeta africana (strain ATCC 700263 / DSM 8902 / Z-7692) TaxID=889378 RepID=H9UIE0_SPIAZ|nr:DUF3276 family protein [Spirochaeta africana]AFG37283.1 Protein of unknown function (DUF3276) [Spirochaeta africana DSM 8902]